MDQGEEITDVIIAFVMRSVVEDYGGRIDQEAILRGIACAYTSFAYRLNAQQDAKELLVNLADQLDDPVKLHWALTHVPGCDGTS